LVARLCGNRREIGWLEEGRWAALEEVWIRTVYGASGDFALIRTS
jgi:hypothetical protein